MKKYTITDKEWENVISKIRELENENQKLTDVIKGIEKNITMENSKNELWDKRGYDLYFLDSLTDKEIVSLHDTEFFYND
tara:strand:- start:224 stop:463 length:240 start_codon:yes stop_codon:yes gene_type:complete